MRKRITVRGSGMFPFDMLRYDHCFPETTDDAVAMVPPRRPGSYSEVKEVNLVLCDGKCTKGRWQSFGWTVVREV